MTPVLIGISALFWGNQLQNYSDHLSSWTHPFAQTKTPRNRWDFHVRTMCAKSAQKNSLHHVAEPLTEPQGNPMKNLFFEASPPEISNLKKWRKQIFGKPNSFEIVGFGVLPNSHRTDRILSLPPSWITPLLIWSTRMMSRHEKNLLVASTHLKNMLVKLKICPKGENKKYVKPPPRKKLSPLKVSAISAPATSKREWNQCKALPSFRVYHFNLRKKASSYLIRKPVVLIFHLLVKVAWNT